MPRPNLITDSICPFCDFDLKGKGAIAVLMSPGSWVAVDCPCCGLYHITGSAIDSAPHWDDGEQRRNALAFAIRRMTDRPDPPRLTSYVLEDLRKRVALPRPENLLDEFILWIGKHSEHVGHAFRIDYPEYRCVLGAANVDAFNFLTEWIERSGLFHCVSIEAMSGPQPLIDCYLNPEGWARYSSLTHSREASRHVFMAMEYGDDVLDSVVRDHWTPAVAQAGFELRRLDQGQGAGLIDDHLRVQIRTARLLVCDLTHGNRGAYWEAGFAEGLGIPVIYTCRRDVFEDKDHKDYPHFDTNHWLTVPWDAAKPAEAGQNLKDTIRATLPNEAALAD